MRERRIIQRLLVCAFVSTVPLLNAAVVIPGNSSTGESFAFPVSAHVYDAANQLFFVAAGPDAGGIKQANEFAVSVVSAAGTNFVPLAPQLVSISGMADQTNPLYDAGILFLGLVYGHVTINGGKGMPVVVTSLQPSQPFFYAEVNPSAPVLIPLAPVGDANGMPTTGIVGLSYNATSFEMFGVKPTAIGSSFGDPGSGLALFVFGVPQGLAEKGLYPLNAQTGMRGTGGGIAVPFDVTQPVLKIGDPLASLGQVIDIHFDHILDRFYIAVQLQAGATSTDGGRALVVGMTQGEKLVLIPIAPDSAFDTGGDQIVGGIGANEQLSIHKVRTMRTTTNLAYAIVVGGNGDSATTARMVYALPLASRAVDPMLNGTLANANVAPVENSSSQVPFRVFGRTLNQVALQPSDTVRATDAAAFVGGAELESGDIDDIFVMGDTVFVAVGTPDVNQLPGIYYSQAIFDDTGKVKGWTLWQRVAGTTAQTFGFVFEQMQGNFTFMSGADAGDIFTVQQTQWGSGSPDLSAQLVTQIQTTLPRDQGGIEKLIDKQSTDFGLHDISLLLATGGDTVTLAQTGQVVSGVLQPTAGPAAWPLFSFDNGTINTTLPTGPGTPIVVSIAGGVLTDVSKLVTAEVITNGASGDTGWLVVGGTHGVAILSDAAGGGWDTATGLGPNFVGLHAGMSFKLFGSYSFVRKLVQDGNFLYVLTDYQLDRIDLTAGNPGLGQINPVTIATSADIVGLPGSLSDCLVSGPFALLGTTNGLVRSGNAVDIRVTSNVLETGWKLVPPLEGTQAVQQIIPITKTNRASDATNPLFDGANIYVLNTYRGKQRSQITRFTIEPVTTTVDDTTLMPIPDRYVVSVPSFLLNYGALRTQFVTDGALFMAGRDRIRSEIPIVTVPRAPREPQSGIAGRELGVPQAQIILPLAIDEGSTIATMLRSHAAGNWFIAGDFGLRINE